MDWTRRQNHILTGDGRLEDLYLSFKQEELPHFHKCQGNFWDVFSDWQKSSSRDEATCISGCWKRPLFVGGWEHSDANEECVVNMQTPSIFIDIRVPCNVHFARATSLKDLSMEDLRLFARRHAFAGVSKVENHSGSMVATRHHVIDWNFVGKMRTRPNKWRIELRNDNNAWKEWGWARDKYNQHIYMERWERIDEVSGPYFAIRRHTSEHTDRDAILVVCGNLFSFIEDRSVSDMNSHHFASLIELVDASILKGDRKLAESYLDLTACHGSCYPGEDWKVKFSLQPWLIGSTIFSPKSVQLFYDEHYILWDRVCWHIVECTFSEHQLRVLFGITFPEIVAKL